MTCERNTTMMRNRTQTHATRFVHGNQAGMTIVELLVAAVIGLIVLGGTLQIFMANRDSYRLQDAMAHVQENGRFAVEFLTRDIRMVGYTGCPATENVANTLNNSGTDWWADFGGGGLRGYAGDEVFDGKAFGTGVADRIVGTEAIAIRRGSTDNMYRVVMHSATAASFKLDALHNLQDGSVVLVCDSEQASIFQVTNASSSNVTVVHNTGTGTPGNCTKGLGFPVVCTANGTPYTYGTDAMLHEFSAQAYYIGLSADGTSRSLYRIRLGTASSGTAVELLTEELISGVEDIQIRYGEDTTDNGIPNRYVSASDVADWDNVVTVRLGFLTVGGNDGVIDDSQTITYNGINHVAADSRFYRAFTTTVGIRNRLP